MNAAYEAVTPTAVRTFPTALNRGDLTVRETIDAYMAGYAGRDSSRAMRAGYWSHVIGETKLRDLDSDLIADVLDQLASQPVRKYVGKDEQGRRLYRDHRIRSGKTVNRYRTTLSAVLTWARQKRLTPKGWRNPCHDVKGAPEGAGRVRYLSADERRRLLSAARISAWPKLYLLVLMAITTGARRGNCSACAIAISSCRRPRTARERQRCREPRTETRASWCSRPWSLRRSGGTGLACRMRCCSPASFVVISRIRSMKLGPAR